MNYPGEHPEQCLGGPLAPLEERVQAAIDEVLYDKKFFKKFDCVQQ